MHSEKRLIRLRLSLNEHVLFMRKVEESGLSQSAFMRRLINGAVLSSRPCAHHAELLSVLSVLSNDAGEILKRLREQGALPEQEAERLRRLLADTWLTIAEKY